MDEALGGGFLQIHHFHRIKLVCIIKDGYPKTTRRSLDNIIFISTPQWGLWGKTKCYTINIYKGTMCYPQ
jgi:hypothetical protein